MQFSNPNLHFRFSAPLWRRITAFWSWWIRELAGMLPPALRRRMLPRPQRLFLELDGNDVVLSQGAARDREELTRYALENADTAPVHISADDQIYQQARELVLCLPADKVLTKSVTLPIAAEENLREVLSFEMDRQTPFTTEQIYYDFVVVARSPAERTLKVELVLVVRNMLDELLTHLDSRGLRPDRVTLQNHKTSGIASVNLLPADKRQRKAVTPQLVNLALATLALLLLISAVSLPLLDKRNRIQELDSLLEQAGKQADNARQLRKKVDRLKANSQFLIDKKQSSFPVLQVMDELTRILPDDTWITRLDIKGLELQIQGQSSSAAALIPLIESSSILHNPRFRSPVTQIPRSEVERFHLSAEIREATP